MRRRAKTLLELIIVLAIMGILFGMLLPVLLRFERRARDTTCVNNMRQMNSAMWNLLSRQRKLPDPAPPLRAAGWAIEILPYLEEVALWQQLKDSPRMDAVAGMAQHRPKIMTCPNAWDGSVSVSSAATSNYTVPTSHYSMRVLISRTSRDYAGFHDVELSSRIPWIQSPENSSTLSGAGPHDGGYFDEKGGFFGD
jgi:type II secretory pathway pseudopilin PulG